MTKKPFCVAISLAILTVVLAWPAQAQQTQTPAKATRTHRLTSELVGLVNSLNTASELTAAERAPVSRGRSVGVSIRYDGGIESLRTFVLSIGGTVQSTVGDITEAYVPVSELMRLGEFEGVRRVETIRPPQSLVTSQGVTVHNASNWHSFGISGAPVKVGIIDVGFAGYAGLIGSELPAPAAVRCYSNVGTYSSSLSNCAAGGENHGTAVAEALVDVAPGVTLLLANPLSKNDLYATVQWMISQGVKVINHSVRWEWDGPGDGTSPIANSPLAAVNAAAAAGVLWVNAAGNSGDRQTWTAPYVDADGDGWMEFSGAIEANAFSAGAGQSVAIQVRWQDSWSAAAKDLDVRIYDSFGYLVASSVDYQTGLLGDRPYEDVSFTAPYSDVFEVSIRRISGAAPSWLQVQTWTGHKLHYSTSGYSIANPAESANPGLLAVGAANASTPSVIEPYSSQGPTIDGRVKPDIVGVDHGNSATLGQWDGTSQAAPHVAGLAALVLSQWQWLTPAEIANYLKSTAQPRGTTVPNYAWGVGLAYLPSMVLCNYAVSPTTLAHPSAAGYLGFTVSAPAGCGWSASSSSPWLTVSSGPRSGDGVITVAVAENPLTYARTGTLTIAGKVMTVSQAENRPVIMKRRWASPTVLLPHDFDGDGRADPTIVRAATGHWFIGRSGGGSEDVSWGAPSLEDLPVPGDYDGDGKADVAVYRRTTGEWFIRGSAAGFISVGWGAPSLDDVPVPADYDGDGLVDVAVFRRSSGEWFVSGTSVGPWSISWGAPSLGDAPVPADYDGDGKADIAVYRASSGQWLIALSKGGSYATTWGNPSLDDRPIPADYDGDGKTDIAIYRGSTGEWFVARTQAGFLTFGFGAPSLDDVPVPADYDGDGQADVAVYRASTGGWFISASAGGGWSLTWGAPSLGDYAR